MVLKKLLLNDIYCKLVFSIDSQKVLCDNEKYIKCYCCRNDKVKHIMCKVKYSPHYTYVMGNKKDYINYMKSSGIYAGYGLEHSFSKYDNLIKDFDKSKMGVIKCVLRNGKYILVDGVHRISILLKRGIESEMVKIVRN